MWFVYANLSTAIAVPLIILFRQAFMNRLPKQLFEILWLLVCVRLMFPVTLPLPARWLPPIFTSLPLVAVGRAYFAYSSFALLWGVVAILLLLRTFAGYLLHLRSLRTTSPHSSSYIAQWASKNCNGRTCRVLLCSNVCVPFTYGFFCPVIVIPVALKNISDTEMDMLLWHEYTHVLRYDAIKKAVLAIVCAVCWINPMCWLMQHLAARDIELCCDEAVFARYNHDCRKSYAWMLLAMEEHKAVALTSTFCASSTQARILCIMNKKACLRAWRLTALCLIFCVAVVAFASPQLAVLPDMLGSTFVQARATLLQSGYVLAVV